MKARKRSQAGSSRTGGHGKPSRVVIITGLSGSGKTVALRAVEDRSFFCVDNLPVSLIGSLISTISRNKGIRNIAIGIDIREKEFFADIDKVLGKLTSEHNLEIIFLEAETEVLIRRFKETRRPHPLGGKIEEAIRAERGRLSVLRERADRVIDTSSFSPHQLRELISSLYLPKAGREEMTVTLTSFGFKYGVPQNIDLLFDVRFLPNPHFVPALRALTGKNRKVAAFVLGHPETREFLGKVKDLLAFLLPLYTREDRSYLSIAIGCTGGNHRSPAIVEELARFLKKSAVALQVIHREIS